MYSDISDSDDCPEAEKDYDTIKFHMMHSYLVFGQCNIFVLIFTIFCYIEMFVRFLFIYYFATEIPNEEDIDNDDYMSE